MSIAAVKGTPVPDRAGATRYDITGPTAMAVQDAIDTLMRTVDGAFGGEPGYGTFIGPIRKDGAWAATGQIIVFQQEPA